MAKIVKKEISLEEAIRALTREVIFEEMMAELVSDPPNFPWEHPDWTYPEDESDYEFDPEAESLEAKVDAMAGGRETEVGELPGRVSSMDPEMGMDRENREKMIDALLTLEFQEGKKTISIASLKEMIRESVRRNLNNEK